MNKILDKDFRNELYKNLVDIGYSKGEATSIVSVKYREALKLSLIEKMKAQIANIEADSKELALSADDYASALSELEKLQEFFEKKAEKQVS